MRLFAVKLNVYTFSTVLKSFAGASTFRQGLKTHALLIKKGFIDSLMLRTGFIDSSFRCGEIKLACHVFEEIPERDIVLWGAMIAGFAHNSMQKEALSYVRWMISERIYPHSVILTTILPVIGEVWAWKLGQEVHAYVVKTKSYSKQLVIQSGYVSNGRLDQALRSVVWMQQEGFKPDVVTVARILPARNVISWTAMIESYVESGRLHEAVSVFRSMQFSKHRSDSMAMARMLNVCRELRAVKLGKEIHGQVLKKDFESFLFVSAEIVKMHGSCGLMSSAKLVFDAVLVKGSMMWTAIIEAYGYNDFCEDSISHFHQMASDGFSLMTGSISQCALNHNFTFKVVFSMCRQARFVDKAC
ncbi:Pentatricopeptide repeat (PPR-like) superfamily protein, putative [Theobroma cacao]|uniref:Pentatricopeptide repeat (PPR-like) superfamily protein, putative n=1 Tax=Theobroma cacao TaxID=3641 RepID=A0A061FR76_THECC|nr:Pentatricopeptide repeat (PPR-like) superfamily protein, putative [Theobroma cacao]